MHNSSIHLPFSAVSLHTCIEGPFLFLISQPLATQNSTVTFRIPVKASNLRLNFHIWIFFKFQAMLNIVHTVACVVNKLKELEFLTVYVNPLTPKGSPLTSKIVWR